MEDKLSFSAYQKTRTDIDDLNKKLEQLDEKKGYEKDPRIYSYKLDKSNTCYTLLRFLPVTTKEGLPIVTRMQHWWENKENGKWFVEFCPTSLGVGTKCPCCEDNGRWFKEDSKEVKNLGAKAANAIGSSRARKKQYFSCVYIIKDSVQPELNGKVMIWQYGTKIYEKIKSAMKPTDQERELGIKPLMVFDLFGGANFLLNLFKEGEFVKYDKCQFLSPEPLEGGDEKKLEDIWNQIYDLSEFSPEKCCTKTYDELKTKLSEVLHVKKDGEPETVGDSFKKENEQLKSQVSDNQESNDKEQSKTTSSQLDKMFENM